MAWVKLDDGFFRNGKVMEAGKDGRSLYLAGLCFCASQLTDGLIPRTAMRIVGAEAEVDDLSSTAARLVELGLWESADAGSYRVHDWVRCGVLVDDLKHRRGRWDAMRKRIAPRIFVRDQHRCVYCGAAHRLTVDHRLPLSRGGSNDVDNLAACCLVCNRAKGTRTAEEWCP